MNLTKAEYYAMLRQDLSAFIQYSFYELNPLTPYLHNWHIDEMGSALEACLRGEITRLIITVPPRSLKSHCVTVAFPAYILGRDPGAKIVAASYGQELADKHARDCRRLMASESYQRIFDTRLSPERQAVHEFMTTAGGFRLATSVGGPLTGLGGNFLIIDDPLKPDEALSETQRKAANDWFDGTAYSRLNNKRTGCIIIIMQRLHEDDLVGHVQSKEPWTVLRFPAIAEEDETHVYKTLYRSRTFIRRAGEVLHHERESLETLQIVRQTIGEYNFAGQYQQSPAPFGGGMIKADWLIPYTSAERPSEFEMILQSWDTANKETELSDYSVCTTWGLKEKHLYLLHVFRKRLDYPSLKRAVREQAEAHQATMILIEDKASGTPLVQELGHEGVHAVQGYKPQTGMNKIMRLHSVSSTLENGFVHIPDKAEWLAEYLHELTSFPKGKYDDQADSTSQALDWIRQADMLKGMNCYRWLEELAKKRGK